MNNIKIFGKPIKTYCLSDDFKDFTPNQVFKVYKALERIRPVNQDIKQWINLMVESGVLASKEAIADIKMFNIL
jgi:hypothetical protein